MIGVNSHWDEPIWDDDGNFIPPLPHDLSPEEVRAILQVCDAIDRTTGNIIDLTV